MDEIKRAEEISKINQIRTNEAESLSLAIEAVMRVVDMYRSEREQRIIIAKGFAKAVDELSELRAKVERLSTEVNSLSSDLDITRKLLEDTQGDQL